MVLVQESHDISEHVVYYLSKRLLGPETHYLHVEKCALEAVIIVQIFRHCILLCKTTIIAYANPM